jgi:RNA polymerase sigma-70 factor, ECF subfamily
VPALALIDRLDLDQFYLFHATRADLLRRLGRQCQGEAEYLRAAALTPTDTERDFLRRGGRGVRPR